MDKLSTAWIPLCLHHAGINGHPGDCIYTEPIQFIDLRLLSYASGNHKLAAGALPQPASSFQRETLHSTFCIYVCI